jgi:broad specificity phosphatase PhoE
MKPKRIFLVRHGESEGNVNKDLYKVKPDYAYELTEKGREQALVTGEAIAQIIKAEDLQFYCSPYWRTRQTYLGIREAINKSLARSPYNTPINVLQKFYEDPRLREQEWGTGFEKRDDNLETARDTFGHFYYRIPNGESCADVYDRVSDFLNTLWRDFEKVRYPENAIIVTHGMTMRLFLMRWFHMTVEEFELLANPKNCEFFQLDLQDGGYYKLVTTPRRYDSRNHPYQFNWV